MILFGGLAGTGLGDLICASNVVTGGAPWPRKRLSQILTIPV